LIVIRRAFAPGGLGTRTVSRPLSNLASTWSASIAAGSVVRYAKLPLRRAWFVEFGER
jgi:hypothetical protein